MRRRIDQVVIVALAVLLGIVLLLYWVEQQVPPPDIPPLAKPKVDPTPVDWTTFTQVLFTHPKQLRGVEKYAALPDFNMFDQRSATDQSELIARLDKRFDEEARPAYERGDLDTAERVCREIIARKRDHQNAADLLRVISERRKALEKEGATP